MVAIRLPYDTVFYNGIFTARYTALVKQAIINLGLHFDNDDHIQTLVLPCGVLKMGFKNSRASLPALFAPLGDPVKVCQSPFFDRIGYL